MVNAQSRAAAQEQLVRITICNNVLFPQPSSRTSHIFLVGCDKSLWKDGLYLSLNVIYYRTPMLR